jgi:tetratricopeptide (TPR) repeat protein
VLLNPHRDPIALAAPHPGVTPEILDSPESALAWFMAEHPALLAAAAEAASTGFEAHAWQIAWILGDFLDRRGRWHDWAAVQHTALDAAQRLGDKGAQAHALAALGIACDRLGRYDDARTHLQQALVLSSDHTGQAYAHMRLGGLNERQGRYEEALQHAGQALTLYRDTRHPAGLGEALNLVGWCHSRLGDHQQALKYCQQALSVQRDIGDRFGEANSCDSLGYAYQQLGQHERAAASYQQALGLFRDLGHRYYEAVALTHIGDSQHAAGDPRAARDAWQHALTILDEMDRANTDQVRTRVDCPDADQVRAKIQDLDRARRTGGTARSTV